MGLCSFWFLFCSVREILQLTVSSVHPVDISKIKNLWTQNHELAQPKGPAQQRTQICYSSFNIFDCASLEFPNAFALIKINQDQIQKSYLGTIWKQWWWQWWWQLWWMKDNYYRRIFQWKIDVVYHLLSKGTAISPLLLTLKRLTALSDWKENFNGKLYSMQMLNMFNSIWCNNAKLVSNGMCNKS